MTCGHTSVCCWPKERPLLELATHAVWSRHSPDPRTSREFLQSPQREQYHNCMYASLPLRNNVLFSDSLLPKGPHLKFSWKSWDRDCQVTQICTTASGDTSQPLRAFTGSMAGVWHFCTTQQCRAWLPPAVPPAALWSFLCHWQCPSMTQLEQHLPSQGLRAWYFKTGLEAVFAVIYLVWLLGKTVFGSVLLYVMFFSVASKRCMSPDDSCILTSSPGESSSSQVCSWQLPCSHSQIQAGPCRAWQLYPTLARWFRGIRGLAMQLWSCRMI